MQQKLYLNLTPPAVKTEEIENTPIDMENISSKSENIPRHNYGTRYASRIAKDDHSERLVEETPIVKPLEDTTIWNYDTTVIIPQPQLENKDNLSDMRSIAAKLNGDEYNT